MKKSLLIALLFFTANHAFCQERTYQINYFAVAYLNTTTENFDWQPKQKVNLKLTIRGELFLINDLAGSYFIRGEQITYQNTDQMIRFLWKAVDYNGNACDLKEDIIKVNGKYTGVFHLYIYYKEYAYYYEVSV